MRNATPLRPTRKAHRSAARDVAKLAAERAAWLRQLAPESLFHRIFDYLPDLTFFAKDARGRLMLASRRIHELYGLSDDRELVGLTDYDLNPDVMARAYTSDDERLLGGKVDVIERLELWFDQQGLPDSAHVDEAPAQKQRWPRHRRHGGAAPARCARAAIPSLCRAFPGHCASGATMAGG